MKITSFVSSREIINQYYRNSGDSNSISLNDTNEWIFEMMELISSPMTYQKGYVDKNCDEDYNFSNFRCKLPCNFKSVIAVYVNGYKSLPSTNTIQSFFPSLPDTFTADTYGEFTDYSGNVFATNVAPLRDNLPSTTTYDINNNYITFNIQSGECVLFYYKFPTDEDGYLLIPDVVEVKRALSDYLQYKMDYILWRQSVIPDKIFQESKNQYLINITQAANSLKMPKSPDDYESLRRSITSLIIPIDSWKQNFQNLNRDNRYIK
jgi:hypothetical protein